MGPPRSAPFRLAVTKDLISATASRSTDSRLRAAHGSGGLRRNEPGCGGKGREYPPQRAAPRQDRDAAALGAQLDREALFAR